MSTWKAKNAENRKKKNTGQGEDSGESMRYAEAQSKSMTQIDNHILADNTSHLMEKVIEYENFKSAIKKVENNKGAPGVDNMQVEELRPYVNANWKRIKQELLEGTYKPAPVRRFEIPKPDGGVRELGIPTALDRCIQQAIQQVLTPIFEPTFSEFSYGFRPGKSARQAVLKAQEYIQNGKKVNVDFDLEKFFDRVNHDLLMTKIAKQIADKRMHKIIRRYLQAGIMLNGCYIH
jgi:RNA-directed DNA polymerase